TNVTNCREAGRKHSPPNPGADTQWAASRNTVGEMRLPVQSPPSGMPSPSKSKRFAPTLPKSLPVGTPLEMKFGPAEPAGPVGEPRSVPPQAKRARARTSPAPPKPVGRGRDNPRVMAHLHG